MRPRLFSILAGCCAFLAFGVTTSTANSCTASPCCSDGYNSDCHAELPDGSYCYCDGDCKTWGDCCTDRDAVCSNSQQHSTTQPTTATPEQPTTPSCQYTLWTTWSSCTRTCGTGSQQRARSLHPTPCDSSGLQQISLSQSRACNTLLCPVDCQTSAWSDWSHCSSTCGNPGEQTRTRQINVQPVGTGRPCGNLTQTRSCSPPPCTTTSDSCSPEGNIVVDRCERRCVCRNGRPTDCCRVRKDITSMSRQERVRYINTYLQASRREPYRSEFRQLLAIHRNSFFDRIHERNQFLPWHRMFLLQFENILRKIDCNVTQPYWDWSLYGNSPWTAPLWQDDPSWFGTDGNGWNGEVRNGPFSCNSYRAIDGQCLYRRFSTFRILPTVVAIRQLLVLSADDVEEWHVDMEGTIHNQFHCSVGGTMCTIQSADAPEFFLHHGFVDKLWADWQADSSDKYDSVIDPNRDEVLVELSERMPQSGVDDWYCSHMLNMSNLPQNVCVVYEEATHNQAQQLQSALAVMSMDQLSGLNAVRCQPPLEASFQLFQVSDEERKQIIAANERLCGSRNDAHVPVFTDGNSVAAGVDFDSILGISTSHNENPTDTLTSQ